MVEVVGVASVTPTKPDVVPVAEILPENVFAVITFVAGFTVNPLSLETATPDPPLTGENKIKCVPLVLATTELIFCAVVAVAALVTDPTHERFPTLSDCNTELPVAGVVAGRLYCISSSSTYERSKVSVGRVPKI